MGDASFWDGAAVICALIAIGISIWSARRTNELSTQALATSEKANSIAEEANKISHSANSYSRESNMNAQKSYDSENKPDIVIAVEQFSKVVTVEEGAVLLPILNINIKNGGKRDVVIHNIGISMYEASGSMSFLWHEGDKLEDFPDLPYNLPAWRQVDFSVTLDVVREKLNVMKATEQSSFMIRVIDQIDRRSEAGPFPAKSILVK